MLLFFFFSSRRRHTRCSRDWSSDVCSSDLSGLRRPWTWGAGRVWSQTTEPPLNGSPDTALVRAPDGALVRAPMGEDDPSKPVLESSEKSADGGSFRLKMRTAKCVASQVVPRRDRKSVV